MYLSTLEKRQRDIKRSDFADAPNLYFNYCAFDEINREKTSLWNRYISYTPQQIHEVLTGGYGIEDMPISVTLDKSGKFKFSMIEDGAVPFRSKAEFNIGAEPDILSNDIKVNPLAQGQGIGRTWLRNVVELSAGFGFPEFHFAAGLQSGGHVWAKAGAYLDRDLSRSPLFRLEEQSLSQNMLARLELARPHLKTSEYGWARALCKLVNKDDIVKIAAMGDITIPRSVIENAKPVLTQFYDSLSLRPQEGSAAFRAGEESEKLLRVFDNAVGGLCEQVSLPRYLQAATSWRAVINFADDRQMERVGEYAGGWRTLKPSTNIEAKPLATLV